MFTLAYHAMCQPFARTKNFTRKNCRCASSLGPFSVLSETFNVCVTQIFDDVCALWCSLHVPFSEKPMPYLLWWMDVSLNPSKYIKGTQKIYLFWWTIYKYIEFWKQKVEVFFQLL